MKPRTMKPGSGTLAALRHTCPHCGAAQGVRCVAGATHAPLRHVHSKRMDLARTSGVSASEKRRNSSSSAAALTGPTDKIATELRYRGLPAAGVSVARHQDNPPADADGQSGEGR